MLVSPKVTSLETVAELAAALYPISVLLVPEVKSLVPLLPESRPTHVL